MKKVTDHRPVLSGATAVRTLAMAATSNSDSLPMFHSVAERFGLLVSSQMRQVATSIKNNGTHSRTVRFSDAVEAVPTPALIAVVKAKEWESQILLAIPGRFAKRIISLMLGNKKEPTGQEDDRQYTQIELRLIQRAMSWILKAMTEAFENVAYISFHIDRTETQPQFANITAAASLCVSVKVDLELEGSKGSIHAIFPHSSLEPIRESLSHVVVGENTSRKDSWGRAVQGAIKGIPLEVNAVYRETEQTLGQIVNWKVGDLLALPQGKQNEVTLVSGKRIVAKGRAGSNSAMLAVQIEETFAPGEEQQTKG